MPQTPKQGVHVSGEVTTPWSVASGEIFAGADYTYRSEIQFVHANDTPQAILNKNPVQWTRQCSCRLALSG